MSRSKNRLNGGILGKTLNTSENSASGIWIINAIREKELQQTWPSIKEAWDSANLSIVKENTGLQYSIAFKPDGSHLYRIGSLSGSVGVFDYTLTSNYDIGNLNTRTQKGISGNGGNVPAAVGPRLDDIRVRGLHIRSNGRDWYFGCYDTLNDTCDVWHFRTATAWDISGLSYINVFDLTSRAGIILDLSFSTDGTKMFTLDDRDNVVDQWTMTTPWDTTTAAWSAAFALNTTARGSISLPRGMFFKPDGTKMYITDVNSSTEAIQSIHEFDLGTAWAVNTGTLVKTTSTILPGMTATSGGISQVRFSVDGTKMFALSARTNGGIGEPTGRIYQFDVT